MKKLNIFSMKRSGQHAIINWLCEQNKPSLHFNSCNSDFIPKAWIMEYGKERIKHNKLKKFNLNKFNLVIYNFEDTSIFPIIDGMRLVILREPKNWIASRLKTGIKNHKIEIWKSYAKSNLFKIIFDKWFVDKEYRKFICNKLGLVFTDDGLNEVFWHGKSSFDNNHFNGRGQKMKVLERWKEYNIELDVETLDLWKKII